MEQNARYCSRCGASVKMTAKFCPGCGAKLDSCGTADYADKAGKRGRAGSSGKKAGKSGKKFPIGVLLAAAAAIAAVLTGCNTLEQRKFDRIRQELDEEYGRRASEQEGPVEEEAAPEADASSGSGSDSVFQMGSLEEKGFLLTMPRSTFPKGSELSYTPLSAEEAAEYLKEEEYTFLQVPANIECDHYGGGLFEEEVLYTVPIPEDAVLDRLAFAYLEEDTKEARIIYPDHFDLENGTMSVALPHFSGVATLTMEERKQVNEFLNQYSKKLAVEQDGRQQAAEALEPYVTAKIKAMNLKKEAEADLIRSTVEYLGGCFKGDEFTPQKYGNTIETGTKTAAALMSAVLEGDMQGQEEALQDIVTGAIMHGWDEQKLSDHINDVLDSEAAGGTAGAVMGNTNALVRMAAKMSQDDWKGAAEELGSIMQSVHPAVKFTTKGTVYLARCIDLEFVTWKQNEIEELYYAYKNGAEGLFGNEIEQQNPESLKRFLETSSGYTKGKMIKRFYNLDKIREVCEKTGWSFEEYKKLADQYRDQMEARATEALIDYFDTRIRQEEEAEKIREKELLCIEVMLQPTIGVLKSGNYERFFGENEAVPYNLYSRLDRLIRVRSLISQYVDEGALEKSMKLGENGFNWGDILNWWVRYVSEYPREEALQHFLKALREYGLLKPGMEKLIREETEETKEEDIRQFAEDEKAEGEEESAQEPDSAENAAEGYWKLKETNVTSHENEIGADGYASYYYSASELTHTEQVSQPATDYHGSGEAVIAASCSAPPQIIYPEEPVVMTVSMDISFGGYYLLWGSYASVSYGSPNDERNGIMYNAGVKFAPTQEDAKNSAYLDTIGNTPCPRAEVYHTFGEGYRASSEMAILFSGCGSDTLWIYEWVE